MVGPNASGKSNLLDSIRFLSDIAKPGTGGLQAAIEARGGFSELRCLHARRPSYIELDVYVGNDENQEKWRYVLRFNQIGREKRAVVVAESVYSNGNSDPLKQRQLANGDDALEYSQTFLEQVGANKDFRELASFFASCRYLHVVPQIVRDRGRSKFDGEDPFGGDLLRRMKDLAKKSRDPRLRRISQAMQIAVPQFTEIDLQDDRDGIPHLYAKYTHWRPDASRQSERQFSDGTLRLIGLLWSISERGGPLLLEEPELSLNDAVVSELPRMFARMPRLSGRQVIATTHSTALLDDTGIGLGETHRIIVDANGSSVQTLSDNAAISAEVNSGTTISQAVFPLMRPRGIENLGQTELVV